MAGESVHPHGRQHQVDLERCRGDWRGVVAPQCFWIVPLALSHPRRIAKQLGEWQRRKRELHVGIRVGINRRTMYD